MYLWLYKMKKNFLIVLCAAFLCFFSCASYPQESLCNEILENSGSVKITQDSGYIFFDGEGTDLLLIFYPGGLVNQKAYVPFMKKFAEAGIDAVLLKVPMDLAIFKIDAAKNVLKTYAGSYEKIYLGGHSLGGAAASMYAPKVLKKYDNVQGLVLCGAYSTKQFAPDFKVISVKGENDQVLNQEKYMKSMGKLFFYDELTVPGGNHGNFGYYGAQKGDGPSFISQDQQQFTTVEFVLQCVAE